jgi:hypothetical protein
VNDILDCQHQAFCDISRMMGRPINSEYEASDLLHNIKERCQKAAEERMVFHIEAQTKELKELRRKVAL